MYKYKTTAGFECIYLDDLLKEKLKNKEFRKAYQEEVVRLRLPFTVQSRHVKKVQTRKKTKT
jgi:hypothetical protein